MHKAEMSFALRVSVTSSDRRTLSRYGFLQRNNCIPGRLVLLDAATRFCFTVCHFSRLSPLLLAARRGYVDYDGFIAAAEPQRQRNLKKERDCRYSTLQCDRGVGFGTSVGFSGTAQGLGLPIRSFVTTAPVRSFRGLCEYTLEKAKRGLEGNLTGCVLFRVMMHSEFPDSTEPVCKQMMVGHVVTSIERATELP